MKARVLRCLSSWVLLDVPLSESEGLVHDCFSALPDPELFDTAVEAIVNAISQPDSQRCVFVCVCICFASLYTPAHRTKRMLRKEIMILWHESLPW